MKKILIIIVVLGCIGGYLTYQKYSISTSGWKKYTNDKYGLEIQYPTDSRISTHLDGDSHIEILGLSYDGSSKKDEWHIDINVLEKNTNTSFQQWWNKEYELCQSYEMCLMAPFKELLKTSLNGYSAYKSSVPRGGYGDTDVDNFTYYIENGNNIYTLTKVANWQEAVLITDQIVSTFKIKK